MNQILDNKYTIINEIGEGVSGKVFVCKCEQGPRKTNLVAIKQISEFTTLGKKNDYLNKELEIIKFLIEQNKNENVCENVLQIYDVFKQGEYFYIVSEYCQQGDLLQYLTNNHMNLSQQNYLDIILQIAQGIQYLHSINLAHRDLKPENILMKYDAGLQLVITDFGISSTQDMKSTVGTVNYMAPEIFLLQNYDKTVDIWSFGCIMYEVIYNQQLFSAATTQKIVMEIKNFQTYQKEENRPLVRDLNQIIKSCLSVDPSQRPSMQEVLLNLQELDKQYNDQQDQQYEDDESGIELSYEDSEQIDEQSEDDEKVKEYYQPNKELKEDIQKASTQENSIQIYDLRIIQQQQKQEERRDENTKQINFKGWLGYIYKKCLFKIIKQKECFKQNNQQQILIVSRDQVQNFLQKFSNNSPNDEYKVAVLLHHILNRSVKQNDQLIQQIEKVINDDDDKRYFQDCLDQCVIQKLNNKKIDKFFELSKNQKFQQIFKKLSFTGIELTQSQAKYILNQLKENNFQFSILPLILIVLIFFIIKHLLKLITQKQFEKNISKRCINNNKTFITDQNSMIKKLFFWLKLKENLIEENSMIKELKKSIYFKWLSGKFGIKD